MMPLSRKVTKELPRASNNNARVVVPPEVPLRADAVVTVEAEAVAVVAKAVVSAETSNPALLLLMRMETPLTLIELNVVAADRDTRVSPVRMDTLKTDARVMNSEDVVTARLAVEEATGITTESPKRKKPPPKVKPLLLRRLRLLPLMKRRRKKLLLPSLRKKSRRRPSLKKKRKRKKLALPSTISLLIERPLASRVRAEKPRR